MPKHAATIATLVLVTTLMAGAAFAQQPGPPTIFFTSWMCDRGALDELVETAAKRDIPIAQELVNQGKLWSYTVMVHSWGDEWNYVTVMLADDLASGVAANDEFSRLFEAQYGEDEAFLQRCTTHRDDIYTGSYVTEGVEGVDPEPEYAIALSYFACPLNVIDEVVEQGRQQLLPAAQASVKAGKGYFTAAMRHAWADEWTYIIARGARDIPSLIAFVEDTATRAGDPPGAGQAIDACRAHKDNIYRVVLETKPKPQ